MRYEFAKCVYQITNYNVTRELWSCEETKSRVQQMGEDFLSIFTKIQKDVERVRKKCLYPDGSFMPRHHIVGMKTFEKRSDKACSKQEVLQLFFVLIEAKLYEGEHVMLYKTLLEAAGHEYLAFSFASMEEIILSYILQTQQDYDTYASQIAGWKRLESILLDSEEEGDMLRLPYVDNVNCLSFEQWKETLDKGLEAIENEKRTRLSMASIGNEFISVLKDKTKVGKKNIQEVFSMEMFQRAINAQERRKWYFMRILSFVIEKQIQDILKGIENYRAGKEGAIAQLQKCVADCWLEKEEKSSLHFAKSWSQVAENPNLVSAFSMEQIKEELYHSRVVPAQIAKNFNYCFDAQVLEDENEVDEQVKKGYAFEGYKLRCHLHAFCEMEDYEKALRTRAAAYRIQDMLMYKKCKVSREMLLLTVLLARALGVDIDMDYTLNHVLNNSRFPNKLNGSIFDIYFEDVMDDFAHFKAVEERISVLQMRSGDLEEQYLGWDEENEVWNGGIAVFHEILYAKDVS